MLEFAKRLLEGEFGAASIPLPTDVVVGASLDADVEARTKDLASVSEEDKVLDIGPATADAYAGLLQDAGTILWNGPVGVFEHPQFAAGTRRIAMAVAESTAFSIAGGGDTLAALDQFHVTERISYVSTGGGAFLEFIEGKTLPAVEILQTRA
jgi:phosphoglycerate kinase